MKLHKVLFSLILALYLLFGMTGNAFAASYTGDDVKPGLSGIQPGDELTHPDNTDWATLTASWGVRVTFVDWDETELKTEVVPVADNTPGSSSAPAAPTRSGYTFTGWERHDTTNGTATLNDDGTVTGVNGPGPIVFIAKYEKNPTPVGALTVSKTVSGKAADSSMEFSFTVTLGDKTVNGAYGDMSFTNGVATFTLKGGESKTAVDLPAGTTYTVSEADYSGEGYTTTKTGDTGTIEEGKTATAAFTNTKKAGDLTVSKTVAGNMASRTKAFSFTVTLDNADFSGTYGDMTFVNGVATFTLKSGKSVTAEGLPAGMGYTVTEEDYSSAGYVTTKTGDTGTIKDGETAKASFTNVRNNPYGPPKTGDSSNILLWAVLLTVSAGGFTWIIRMRKKV